MAKTKILSNPKLTSFVIGKADKAFKHTDIVLALSVVAILLILLFPIPKFLLDFSLAISITSAVVILMSCLFINKPLDLSSFPTILLITAILRLSLNIASTRLILSEGHTGIHAAGKLIEAFGELVMGGNIVIGIIVFAILTIINFVVITKGSGRIAEVAARFSLDAMPGKQMAIDADLSAGLIDEEEAKARRKEIETESAFYGAMDGANKFVRGDAIAGILIIFINFIAGIIIGMVQKDMTFANALKTYTILTIGDGLVSQIPALIISLSTGLLVSKSGVTGSADKAIFGQIGKHPQALWISSVLMLLIAIMPNIPAMPFLTIGSIIAMITWITTNQNFIELREKEKQADIIEQEKAQAPEETDSEEAIVNSIKLEHIRIELGYNLVSLINYAKGTKLPDQIKALRKQIARDLGFIIPSVRIQDNLQLGNNDYAIYIKEIKCGESSIRPDMIMVMNPTGEEIDFIGEKTVEPAFGLDAMWVPENYREEAILRNYTIVEPMVVITTHLTEIIKDNITELLSYGETQKLLDNLQDEHKKLLSEIVPSQISVSGIQKILQNLLSEMVSIRDLSTILEAIAEVCRNTKNLMHITEYVRSKLARQISHANLNSEGYLPIIMLSPKWEQLFIENISVQGEEKHLTIPPSKIQEFMQEVKQAFEEQAIKGEMPALLTSPQIRPFVRSVIERFRPITVVLSQSEIHARTKIKTLGQI